MQQIKETCRYYRGHIPCKFHKESGAVCDTCRHFDELRERIFIIKLGAVGDVIRTTPLLRKLKETHPHAEITWLTCSPDVLPQGWVDNTLSFSLDTVVWLEAQHFDWLINLDKDKEAISLAERISASKKSGFTMNTYGKCVPMGRPAENDKWLTGLRDDVNKSNTKHYVEEIFSICEYEFHGEEYILPVRERDIPHSMDSPGNVVGLNTGCGARWPTRLWPETHWQALAQALQQNGHTPVFLGGPQEEEKNIRLSKTTGASYWRTPSLDSFIGAVNRCDVVVTQVTMAMHVAIALKKYLVLLNNIFNRNEFYLYGRGTIVEPALECLGCFKQNYNQACTAENCMDLISVSQVMAVVQQQTGAFACRNIA